MVPDAPAARLILVGLTETEAVDDGTVRSGATLAANVTALLPLLVKVMVCESGKEDTTPNETVVGLAKTVVLIAAPVSSSPEPIHSTFTGSPKSSVVTTPCLVEFTSADLICAAVHLGFFCLSKAAAPAVIGEEKLVPSAAVYRLELYNS